MRNFVCRLNFLYMFRGKAFVDEVCVQGPGENKERKEEKGVTRD